MALSGITDNLGNTFILTRMMTGKFPAVVILAELSAQLRRQEFELNLEWVPRDQNEEADALTNEHYAQFDETLRIEVDVMKVKWLVMDKLMGVAEDIYQEVKERRLFQLGERPVQRVGRGKRRPEERLRARDPW